MRYVNGASSPLRMNLNRVPMLQNCAARMTMLDMQICQLSRFCRESHDFLSFLTVLPSFSRFPVISHGFAVSLTIFCHFSRFCRHSHDFLSFLTVLPSFSRFPVISHGFAVILTIFCHFSRFPDKAPNLTVFWETSF